MGGIVDKPDLGITSLVVRWLYEVPLGIRRGASLAMSTTQAPFTIRIVTPDGYASHVHCHQRPFCVWHRHRVRPLHVGHFPSGLAVGQYRWKCRMLEIRFPSVPVFIM